MKSPHGRTVIGPSGIMTAHMTYALDHCQGEDGKWEHGKKHKWDGVDMDNGYGPSPTCSVCGCNYATYLMMCGD